MQQKPSQQLYSIVVRLASGATKVVTVRASSQEIAERRALKRTQNGIAIERNV